MRVGAVWRRLRILIPIFGVVVVVAAGLLIRDQMVGGPSVADLERRLDALRLPATARLIGHDSSDTCFTPCPNVLRFYTVTGPGTGAVAEIEASLRQAGYTKQSRAEAGLPPVWLDGHIGIAVMDETRNPPSIPPSLKTPSLPPGTALIAINAARWHG